MYTWSLSHDISLCDETCAPTSSPTPHPTHSLQECTNVAAAMSDAVDGFNDQCVSFLRIPAFACYKIREVMGFVEEISDNLGLVMSATGKGVQTVLRSLKKLPYGI